MYNFYKSQANMESNGKKIMLGFRVVNELYRNVYLIKYKNDLFPEVNFAVLKYFKDMESYKKEFLITSESSLISNTFVKVYTRVEVDDAFGLVLEYCEGGSLSKNFPKISNENELLFNFKHLLKALKDLHKNNIAHRDISNNNIFIKKNYFKIGDFGCSKILDYTSENTLTGTPNYLSPGLRCQQKHQECSSNPYLNDIWSMGVIFFELALGKCANELFSKDGKVIKPSQIIDLIDNSLGPYSEGLKDVIKKMLAYEESDRLTAKKAYKKISQLFP